MYPSEKELQEISEWDDLSDPKGWFDLIMSAWHPDYEWCVRESDRLVIYKINTGGWSGNEDIIEAMAKSIMWPFTWEQSTRGGHFIFQVRKH